ncbi:unnamed protein product [Brassica rapa subsp. trilocularis]
MKKLGENKFTWVIKNFSSLQHETFHDYTFEIDTDKDRTFAPSLRNKDGGTLVNDEVKILAEVDVLESIDKLYIPRKFEKTTIPQSKIDEKYAAVYSLILEQPSAIRERIQVNGFQVLPSQVETVRSIFERHPDIAVGFHSKNQHLRKACMDSLLCLIETMCQSLQELSSEDLVQADVALTSLKDLGFKLDWLEKKLDQVKVNKEKEMSCLAILQETEESLLNLKQKCSELKAELTETKTPLSFDDSGFLDPQVTMSREHKRIMLLLQRAEDKLNRAVHNIAKSEKYFLDSAAEYGNRASNLELCLDESGVSYYLQMKEECQEAAKKYAAMRHFALQQQLAKIDDLRTIAWEAYEEKAFTTSQTFMLFLLGLTCIFSILAFFLQKLR